MMAILKKISNNRILTFSQKRTVYSSVQKKTPLSHRKELTIYSYTGKTGGYLNIESGFEPGLEPGLELGLEPGLDSGLEPKMTSSDLNLMDENLPTAFSLLRNFP
jgi:hypothetical protein